LPTKAEKGNKGRNLLVGGGIGIVVLLLIWGALGKGSDPNEVPNITSGTEYREVLAKAERLSLQHLVDLDNGIELTEVDKKDLREAAVLFDGLSQAQPTNIAPYLGAGKIYQALGNDDAAIKRFQQGLAVVPKDPILAVKDTAIEMHYLFSRSLFNVRHYDEALSEINRAITQLPFGSPIYLSQRAAINIQLRKYKEANDDLVKALEIDPDHKRSKDLLKFLIRSAIDLHQSAATKKLNKKDYKGAIKDCNTGLNMAPNHPQLIALRGAAYLGLGNKAKAKADADTLAALDPNSQDAKTLYKQLKK
jgi:tetratricopeptide (TPR) repeat protein